MSKAAIRRREQRALRDSRPASSFKLQVQSCDLSLSRACVERDDGVPSETLLENFLLIPSGRQDWHLCSRVVCHDVGTVIHYWIFEKWSEAVGHYLRPSPRLSTAQLRLATSRRMRNEGVAY